MAGDKSGEHLVPFILLTGSAAATLKPYRAVAAAR